jgi:hypothetical protein
LIIVINALYLPLERNGHRIANLKINSQLNCGGKMGDLDSIVNEAKNKISAVISKPKMTEKLLSKPPFRFLHDTITAITAATGFGEGLYSGAELDSASMNEKFAKMSYLDKIFQLVGICKVKTFKNYFRKINIFFLGICIRC